MIGNVAWSFAAGFVCGFVLSRIWCLVKVVRMDKRDPLPNGRRRSKWSAVAVDPRAFSALIGIVFLAWSVLQTQANADENKRISDQANTFAAKVATCQTELIEAIKGSRDVSTDNDRLSQEERGLLADGQRFGREWLGALLTPPPEVAALDTEDPVRVRYNVETTRAYFDRVGDIERRIDANHAEQARNERSRPALPNPRCAF